MVGNFWRVQVCDVQDSKAGESREKPLDGVFEEECRSSHFEGSECVKVPKQIPGLGEEVEHGIEVSSVMCAVRIWRQVHQVDVLEIRGLDETEGIYSNIRTVDGGESKGFQGWEAYRRWSGRGEVEVRLELVRPHGTCVD